MNNNPFIVALLASLDKQNSQKQINADIKQLEKSLNKISLIGSFSNGDTKKELNTYINQIESQLNYIKLQAKIDNKNLQRERNEALKNISFNDIDINVNDNKTKTKVQKVVAEAKTIVDKKPLALNIELKKEKLDNQLTTFLNKNGKINESSILLEEADKLRKAFSNIGDKDSLRNTTDQFQLFKSEVAATGYAGQSTTDKIKNMIGHVTKIGSAFGIASTAINQFFQSQRNLKVMDTVLTEISKTSEITKKQLIELGNTSFDTANKYGQLANNYLLGVQEMARSGYEDKAKELGEVSLLAQSAGDMTAEMANNYILATDAAYKYSGGIKQLTSALDGANYISNKNSASLTDIADGIRVSASYAANAGVEIEQLTAAEATMIAVTKRSGSEMGRAFRSILLNLQQISGEFDGEIIDKDQLKKVEARCHSLGVELETLKDGVATLRNPMEVLKELSEVYNRLPENSADKQGLISDLGGKYHANALTGLLSRWDLYEKMLFDYSQGTGSALTEAYKTADSWEGRLNQLQNSWDSFVNTLTNKDAIKGGISFLDGTIQALEQLTGAIGAIPTIMMAVNALMATLDENYGITQLFNQESGKMDIQGNLMGIDFTAFKAQKKHFEEVAVAIDGWNNKLRLGQADLNKFEEAIVKNSVQFKSYLQTCSVDAPASLAGYKSYLNAAGVSTDALRLKTILLTSAMSLGIGVAIQLAVTGISKLIQANEDLRMSTQDAANAYAEKSSSINDYASKYQELHQALLDAKGDEEATLSIKSQLLNLQQELNDQFGDEYGKLNLVTDAYRDQTNAIKALNKEVAQTYLNENVKGLEQAERAMTGKDVYNLNKGSLSMSNGTDSALIHLAQSYQDKGVFVSEKLDEMGNGLGEYEIKLAATSTDAEDTINQFMDDVREKAKSLGDEHLFDDTLKVSSKSLADAKEITSKYGEQFTQSLMGNITLDDSKSKVFDDLLTKVSKYNDAVAKSSNPFNDKDVKTAYDDYQKLKQEIQKDESWKQFSPITDEIFEDANTKMYEFARRLQSGSFSKGVSKATNQTETELRAIVDAGNASDPFVRLVKGAENYNLSLDDVISILKQLNMIQDETANSGEEMFKPIAKQDAIAKVKEMSEGFESLDKIMTSMSDRNPFDFSLLDDKNFKDNFSECGEAYEDFIETVSNSPKDVEACQSAFDDLVTAFIEQKDIISILDDSTKGLVESMLENMGVTNAEAVVTDLLAQKQGEAAAQKAFNANASFDLANATAEEVVQLANEAGVADQARQAFYSYIAQKMLDSAINTGGDITALANVINALGLATSAWQRYYAVRAQMAATAAAVKDAKPGEKVATPHGWGGELSVKDYQNQLKTDADSSMKSYAQDLENMAKNTKVTANYGGGIKAVSGSGGSGGGGGGSSAKAKEFSQEIDNASQSIKVLEADLATFNGILNNDNQPYEDQIATIDKLIAKQGELVNAYRDTLAMYEQQWADAASKITKEQKNAIASGQRFDISQFTNESEYNLVKDAQDAYNKCLDVQQKFDDESLQLQESYIQKYNAKQKELDNHLDTLKYSMDSMQNEIDRVDALDGQASKKSYKRLINLSKQQENYYRQKRNLAKTEMNSLSTNGDSKRYYELKKEIAECDNALSDCKKSQIEWNKSIMEIPINQLEKANDELDKQINKQEKLKDSYDNAISGVTDILDEQIEAYEKEREASDKFYDEKIENLEKEKDAIQDEIDAIQKKNDETDRAIETEKKLAALEKAKTQKTIKVLKNGKWEWDVDYDAIREAQKDYDDQLSDNKINDLQNKQDNLDQNINDLNDQKQDASDKIQEKIDALEEYRNKWEEIAGAYEKEQNKQGAMDFFGMTEEQLRNALLNKNLDLITQINTSYTNAELRMAELEKTKEKNEELIATFQSYIDSWQNGTISIGEAKSKIQEIVSDNELELETINARTYSVDGYRDSWDETEVSIGENLANINETEIKSNEDEALIWEQKLLQVENFRVSFGTILQNLYNDFSYYMDSMMAKFSVSADAMEVQARRIADAIKEAQRAEREEREEKDSEKTSSGKTKPSGSSSNKAPTGPAAEIEMKTRGAGAKTGNAGNMGNVGRSLILSGELTDIVNDPPKNDEVLKILSKNDFVMTENQTKGIINHAAYNIPAHEIPEFELAKQNASPTMIQVGDIHIDHANDVNQLANDIKNKLPLAMLQQMYRK